MAYHSCIEVNVVVAQFVLRWTKSHDFFFLDKLHHTKRVEQFRRYRPGDVRPGLSSLVPNTGQTADCSLKIVMKDGRRYLNFKPHRYRSDTTVSVALNVKIAKFTFQTGQERAQSVQHEVEGNIVYFNSLKHFIGLCSPNSEMSRPLLSRMKWLGDTLNRHNIYPKGENRQFLKVTTKDSFENEEIDLFSDQDCCIPSTILRRHDVRKLSGEMKAVFIEGKEKACWKVGMFSECSGMWHMENIDTYDRVAGGDEELVDIDFDFC